MILIDPPNWSGHGNRWSHLASDHSFAELHDFADLMGLSPALFDRDHYDVPARLYGRAVALGAKPASTRDIVAYLALAGLRRPRERRTDNR